MGARAGRVFVSRKLIAACALVKSVLVYASAKEKGTLVLVISLSV